MAGTNPETLLEKFECRRCNLCCKQAGYVYITPQESEGMAHFLRIDIYEFVDQYCDLLQRNQLVLKKHADESCIFLTEEGCSLHAVKPRQCRDFPVKWRTVNSLSYCVGLKRLFPHEEMDG